MHVSILLPIWGAVAFAIFKAISMVIESRRHAARAKELGAQDAPYYIHSGIGGYNSLKLMQAADKEKRFPDYLIERQDQMSDVLGRVCSTFYFVVLGQKTYFTSDPKNIQAVLATQFQDYEMGIARRGNLIATLGDGIFVQDGKAWEHSRGLLRPNFVRDQITDLELEERHVQNLMAVLKTGADGWTAETDIQTLFFRLTIDSATEFLFGESVDSQIVEAKTSSNTTKKEKDELAFSSNFDSAQMWMARRLRFGDLYWLKNPKEYKENNRIVNDFVQHYVNLALQQGSTEKKTEEGHNNNSNRYILLDALAQQTRDPAELKGALLNILLAGRDTTASLLSWLFHELLRHPAIHLKLRTTILEAFGPYNPTNTDEITFTALKNCQYLQYCLNETLRLWPVVTSNARRSKKATTLPRGGGKDGQAPVYVEPQTDVTYSVHVMHRRKDLWGEDADEFKPERFQGRRPGWEYLPFNGGPRICIGQQFALTEASYVAVRLLQRFDKIEGPIAPGPVKSNLSLTNAPADKVRLRMHEASE